MGALMCAIMLASGSRTPDPPAPAPSFLCLQELPVELLFSIARKLEKNTDLRRLSLVSQKLRHVAQEALFKEVLMPQHGIRDFVRTLSDRPMLCAKITSVNLGNYLLTGCPGPSFKLENWSHLSKCRVMVDALYGDGHFDSITKAAGSSTLWPYAHQFFLDILIALAPNLRELTMQLPETETEQLSNLLETGTTKQIAPFQGLSSELLGKRLRVLTILETDTYKLFRTPNVALSSLSRLVRLTIPSDALAYMAREAKCVRQALPSSLQHLQLLPCNRYVLFWFPDLAAAYVDCAFPKFRRIDLHFKACLRDSLLLIDQGRGILEPLRGVVALLSRKYGMSIKAWNGSGVITGDLLEELDAWALHSDFERWHLSKQDEEFSSTVARTIDGVPRRRSKEEIRAFVRRGQPSSAPRRRFKFNPDIDLGGAQVLSFGSNEQPKSKRPDFTEDFKAWLNNALFPARKPGRSSSLSTGSPNMTTDLLAQKDLPPCLKTAPVFAQPSIALNRPSSPLTFAANEWLGVTFFENRDDIRVLEKRTRAGASEKDGSLKRKQKATSAARDKPSQHRTRRVKTRLSNGSGA